MKIIEFLLLLLNTGCIASSFLLMWFFYKWDKYTSIFNTMTALIIYEALFLEMNLIFNQMVLTILFIFIFLKIFYTKCEEIGKELKQQEIEQAIRLLELHNNKKHNKKNISD